MAYLKSTPEISHLKFQLKFLKVQPLILDFKKSVKPDARSVHVGLSDCYMYYAHNI